MGGVLELLRADEDLAGWLAGLAAVDEVLEVGLPAADELPPVLLDLAVPHEDVNDLVSLHGVVTGDRDLRWLVERCARTVVAGIGAVDEPCELPALPADLAAVGRYLYVFVFVAALPHIQAYHARRGIPPDVSRRTLADLGRAMAVHRRWYGTGGMRHPFWLKYHFRGEMYQLGRLQFQRARLGSRTGHAVAAGGLPLGPGDPTLEIHVPDFSGPLTPAACDESVARARDFFARHFPDETYRVATIHSWLLDRQLRDYLPETSNVVRFQDRFRPGYEPTEPADTDPVRFVFGNPDLPLDTLPRRTTLERAIADHLLDGGHWYLANGWFPL